MFIKKTGLLMMASATMLLSSGCQQETAVPANVATRAAGSSIDQKPSGQGSLKDALMSENVGAVIEAINNVTKSGSTASLYFLRGVWEGNEKDTAGIPADFLKSVSVQALIANVLAQANANGLLQIDTGAILDALRAGLHVNDPSVVRASLYGLRPYANDADIESIVKVAEGNDPANSRVAMEVLSITCNESGKAAITRLAASSSNQIARAEAEEIYRSMAPVREASCRTKPR